MTTPPTPDGRIAAALTCLDGLEYEGLIQPYVAAAVRKAVGEPPRNWPPQPGDVWDDQDPFCPAWFAQLIHSDGPADLVMVPVERSPQEATKTPDELLKSSDQLALAYRKAGTR